MKPDHYTYRVTWSAEDGEHVGLCAEFRVRNPPEQHRQLALQASEQGELEPPGEFEAGGLGPLNPDSSAEKSRSSRHQAH
jgi:hypothetical protein